MPILSEWKKKVIRRIYGSSYNALIASDKYYGPLGKLGAAIAVHKAYRQ